MAWTGQHFGVYDLRGQMEKNRGVVAALDKRSVAVLGAEDLSANRGNCSQGQEKKRRLTPEQMEFLEKSFQEDAKLEPERKLLLARLLCLQPRQVAVWFQNRRARWKTKQLERLYVSLKHDYDAVSQEKQRLQDEVERLKAQLMGSAPTRGPVGEKGDEMLESMVIVRCSNSVCPKSHSSDHLQRTDCNYLLSTDEYGHCGSLPGYM